MKNIKIICLLIIVLIGILAGVFIVISQDQDKKDNENNETTTTVATTTEEAKVDNGVYRKEVKISNGETYEIFSDERATFDGIRKYEITLDLNGKSTLTIDDEYGVEGITKLNGNSIIEGKLAMPSIVSVYGDYVVLYEGYESVNNVYIYNMKGEQMGKFDGTYELQGSNAIIYTVTEEDNGLRLTTRIAALDDTFTVVIEDVENGLDCSNTGDNPLVGIAASSVCY